MGTGRTGESLVGTFSRPTSVFLYGPPGPLLDWVAWAVASQAPGGYHWTDVRLDGEGPEPLGPLSQGTVPPEHLAIVHPYELAPDHAVANAAISVGIRPDEHSVQLERLVDFLRLPPRTQKFLSATAPTGPPLVLIVSNGNRLLPFFNTRESVRSANRALTDNGFAILDVFSQVPSDARFVFDHVWRLGEGTVRNWRKSKLEIEQAGSSGSLSSDGKLTLEELGPVASVLARALDPLT